MPTALTHGIVAGAMTQLAPRELPRRQVAVVMVAAALLPDLDVIGFVLGIPYSHPLGHRGFSHSLLAALLVGCLGTALLLAQHRRAGRETIPASRWWGLLVLTTVVAASHGLLDAFTNGGLGIGLLLPFSDERIFFAYRPIRVSPINLLRFTQSRTIVVLGSEALWVWLPMAALTLVVQTKRFLSRRRTKGSRKNKSTFSRS